MCVCVYVCKLIKRNQRADRNENNSNSSISVKCDESMRGFTRKQTQSFTQSRQYMHMMHKKNNNKQQLPCTKCIYVYYKQWSQLNSCSWGKVKVVKVGNEVVKIVQVEDVKVCKVLFARSSVFNLVGHVQQEKLRGWHGKGWRR